jgi:hypothetical protein
MVALPGARRPSRLLALVLAALTVLGSSGSWHVTSDDPDCLTPITHDHSAHQARLARASQDEAPVHCALCHWLQAFRSDAVRPVRIVVSTASVNAGASAVDAAIRSADSLRLPSRAPPA